MPEYVKSFSKLLDELSNYKYHKKEVFDDFTTIAYLSIASQVYKLKDTQIKEYNRAKEKYSEDEFNKLVEMSQIAQNALEERHHDFLGEVFMSSELGNGNRGQYFTPYSLSQLLAQITLTDLDEQLNEKGYITLDEPASGSGGMIIAAAEVVSQKNHSPLTSMIVQATDVDYLCFKMAYIQLSLLNIPANVRQGNTLSLEITQEIYTPAGVYFLNNLNKKIVLSKDTQRIDLLKAS